MSDIAIIGLSVRFPGATDVRSFWRLVQAAKPQFRSVPPGRWRHASFFAPGDRRAIYRSYTDQVAFLDDVEHFSAAGYGIPPTRAKAMDPQQRLVVDLAREAIQDAGWERRPFDRAGTGVYIGISHSDYLDITGIRLRATFLADGSLHGGEPDDDLLAAAEKAAEAGVALSPVFGLAGNLLNMAACTVSSIFDLGGPAFAVDAACSSSLVALHTAVTALRARTCSAALVGGVSLTLTPDVLVGFSRVGALSGAGVCRPFDEHADGFVLGEGAGMVVLRRLADARRDGDRIYAVIKGIGISNDGRADGYLAPRPGGQVAALRAAYADAGVAPRSVAYIETHGTATPIGDQAEIAALRQVVTEDRQGPAYLGSIKALIGHSLSAAGMAGLAKAVLAVHHARIPPHPPTTPRASLGMAEAGLALPRESLPWPGAGGTPRRAAVSSFGFGGTNVHVVLEQAPAQDAAHPRPYRHGDTGGEGDTGGDGDGGSHGDGAGQPWLFLLSAGSVDLLAGYAQAVRDAVEADRSITLAALAYTLATRTLLPARLAVVAQTREEVIGKLGEAACLLQRGRTGELGADSVARERPLPEAERRMAFLYPGHGTQRPGMLGDLYRRFAPLAGLVDDVDARIGGVDGRPMATLLWPDHPVPAEQAGLLTEAKVCEPLLAVLGLGVGRLLDCCGVRADVALGHDVGELPAAAAVGAIAAADAARFASHRGAAVAGTHRPRAGGMLVVEAGEPTFAGLVGDLGGVWLGCVDHPGQVVASGNCEALDELARRCAGAGIAARRVSVSHAFHSPLAAAADALSAEELSALPIQAPKARFISTVTGSRCDDPAQIRAAWSEYCSAPVRFADAVRAAEAEGARVFVQVFGGSSLLTMARRSAAGPVTLVALGAEEPDGGRTFLVALGRLACLGVPVDLVPLFEPARRRLATVPPTPLATRPYSVRIKAVSAQAAPATPVRINTPRTPQNASAPIFDPPTPDPPAARPVLDTRTRDPRRTSGSHPPQALAPIPTGPPPAPDTAEKPVGTAPEATDVGAFPEVVALMERLSLADRLGVQNPYFFLHEGNIRDRTRVAGRELVSFSTYNYLGLSGHQRVNDAVIGAVRRYGSSVSASRILSGDRPLHRALEAALADLLGAEDCLALVSGYATNVSLLGHLMGAGDLIVHDALAHNSILQGCLLSRAARRSFPHNDIAALDAILDRERDRFRRVLVIVEGVYSMDGDIADLPGLIDIRRRHRTLLMVDEAHSIGVLGGTGRGLAEHFAVDRTDVDVWMGTLSKALAGCGGYLAGSRVLVEYLRYTLPGFVFSAGITPPNAAASLAAIQVLLAEPERVARLRANSRLFLQLAQEAGVDTRTSEPTPIIPCIVGDTVACVRLANALFRRGISVDPIMYPAVDEKRARLRFFITSEHTDAQLEQAVQALSVELRELGLVGTRPALAAP